MVVCQVTESREDRISFLNASTNPTLDKHQLEDATVTPPHVIVGQNTQLFQHSSTSALSTWETQSSVVNSGKMYMTLGRPTGALSFFDGLMICESHTRVVSSNSSWKDNITKVRKNI